MKSKQKITKQQLIEIYGIHDVTDTGIKRINKKGKEKQLKTCIGLQINKNGSFKYIHTQFHINPVLPDNTPLNTNLAKLIYIWHYGEIPAGLVIDHINQNPLDCRIENLRLVSEEENLKNKRFWRYPPNTEENRKIFKTKSIVDLREMMNKWIENQTTMKNL